MAENEFVPLYSSPGVRNEGGWTFRLQNDEGEVEDVTITDFSEEIARILLLADGLNTVESIKKKLAKEAGQKTKLTADIISDLSELGVLVDSRRQYRKFHKTTTSSSPYAQTLSQGDVREVTFHNTFRAKKGKHFKIQPLETKVGALSRKRKSQRSFSKTRSLGLEIIGTCLDTAYSTEKRPIPSGGGMYPLRLYAMVLKDAERIPAGYYQYDCETNIIIKYRERGDDEKLRYIFNNENDLYGAPAIVVIAADIHRHPNKYANRGYKLTLLEAGHAAQNIHLTAQELGIASLEYDKFQDNRLAVELELAENEVPLITLALGYGTDPTDKSVLETLAILEEKYIGPGKPVEWVRIKSSSQLADHIEFYGAQAKFSRPNNLYSPKSTRIAFGTARSKEVAYIKAIAEAYERFAAGQMRFDVHEPASKLSEPWLHPNDILPLTKEQYTQNPHLEKFDPDKPWQWVRATRGNSSVLVPVEAVFYPLGHPLLGRNCTIIANSSGVAAHTDHKTAVEHALLELLERDAIMKLWLTKNPPKRVSIQSLSPHYQGRARYWEAKGKRVEALDLSHDGIAIALAIIRSLDDDYPFMGCGAAANTEAFETSFAKAYQEAELSYATAFSEKKKVRQPSPEKVSTPADHGRFWRYNNHKGEIEWLWSGNISSKLPRITSKNIIDVYKPAVIELTHPNDFLHVVRAICPALIPMTFGTGMEPFSHPALSIPLKRSQSPHFFA